MCAIIFIRKIHNRADARFRTREKENANKAKAAIKAIKGKLQEERNNG
jgi:hypothetical protein